MTPQEILAKAADLIEATGWVQEHCAVDSHGWGIGLHSEEAVAFCMLGAIRKVIGEDKHLRIEIGPLRMFEACFKESMPGWNDEPGRTKVEVVQALRLVARGDT